MKAMILAAGHGTRLQPLTLRIPKTLVPVANRPLIDWTIDHLKEYGINEIVINSHHFHKQISDYLDTNYHHTPFIDLKFEPKIMGTGGGIKNTRDFWDDAPFAVINGDIITDIDLAAAYENHINNHPLATLVLHDYGPFNKIQVDEHFNITEIPLTKRGKGLAFTGIHIISPELLDYITPMSPSDIIDCYRELIKMGKPIRAHISSNHYWRDVGTIASYVITNKEALKGRKLLAAQGSRISRSVEIDEWSIIGKNTVIEKNANIARSIIWDNVVIKKGVRIIDSIITSSHEINQDVINTII